MKEFIILFGVPGSGKGTQAKLLVDELGYTHISSGELLRQIINEKSELGQKINDIISKGFFLNDALVFDLVLEKIKESKKYVLDGFPRNINQANLFEKYLETTGAVLKKVIYLNLREEDILKRLSGRRVCKSCKREYNIYFNPTDKENRCDFCFGELEQRMDDNHDVILNRLKIYQSETAPLVDFYRERNLLEVINASNSIEAIFSFIKKILVGEQCQV